MAEKQIAVTVKVSDSWMVKALAKQIHTMKWNKRAPGVIVQPKRIGINEQFDKATKALADAFHKAFNGEDRRVL